MSAQPGPVWRYVELCRKAFGNWPIGDVDQGDHFVLSEDEERFSRAHRPELVSLLWEHYSATKSLLPGNGVLRKRLFAIREEIEQRIERGPF